MSKKSTIQERRIAYRHKQLLRFYNAMAFANRTGLCPVCKVRLRAWYPDGQQGTTCGDDACFLQWLNVKSDALSEMESDIEDEEQETNE